MSNIRRVDAFEEDVVKRIGAKVTKTTNEILIGHPYMDLIMCFETVLQAHIGRPFERPTQDDVNR